MSGHNMMHGQGISTTAPDNQEADVADVAVYTSSGEVLMVGLFTWHPVQYDMWGVTLSARWDRAALKEQYTWSGKTDKSTFSLGTLTASLVSTSMCGPALHVAILSAFNSLSCLCLSDSQTRQEVLCRQALQRLPFKGHSQQYFL